METLISSHFEKAYKKTNILHLPELWYNSTLPIPHAAYCVYSPRYEGCTNDSEGIGAEMERMAARMGGSVKFPFNESECLDADFFKIVADHLIRGEIQS